MKSENHPIAHNQQPNIVKIWLETELLVWQKHQSTVQYLKKNSISIPVIHAPSQSKQKHHILLVSGLHLEEISGPKLLLKPSFFAHWRNQGISFTIFPVINQFGLSYPESSPDHLLRYDNKDRNYNDGWGFEDISLKAIEVALTEKYILETNIVNPFDFAISLHEDSTQPEFGFIYTSNITPKFREHLDGHIKSTPSSLLLSNKNRLLDVSKDRYIDHNYMIVDEKDDGALENWLGEKLNIPTILIEAPFGYPLPTKLKFQQDITSSILNTI